MRTHAQVGLVVSLLVLPSCMDLEARAYAGYMQAELTGELGLAPTAPTTAIGRVGLEDSFGSGEEGSLYARVDATASIFNVTASAFRYDSTGQGTLEAEFGGLQQGLLVDTEVDFLNAKFGVTFDLIDLGFIRLSPGVAVDYFDLDMSVSAAPPLSGEAESLDLQAPVPMLFVQAEGDVGPVSGIVEVGGMSADYGDVDGTFIDVEALLRVAPFSNVELFAGYRYISLEGTGDASGQEFDADLALQGWFVGGGVTF